MRYADELKAREMEKLIIIREMVSQNASEWHQVALVVKDVELHWPLSALSSGLWELNWKQCSPMALRRVSVNRENSELAGETETGGS